MKKILYSAFMVLFALLSINAQTKWTTDKAHSKVQFTVTHLIISFNLPRMIFQMQKLIFPLI